VPAELAGQRPLLERAAAGDREAFALVYDTQVEGVYRYLLAWTGNPTETAELTAQVFHAAIGWLPATTSPEGEAAAWLTAMTRDALAQRQGHSEEGGSASPTGSKPGGPGSPAGSEAGGSASPAGSEPGGSGSSGVPHPALPASAPPEGESSRRQEAAPASVHTPGPAAGAPPEAPRDVVAAVARLKEPEREVVVLRLLLGHSLDHTAHLSGYSRRAVLELQLTACLAVHELTGGTRTGPPPPQTHHAPPAEEFERRLGRWEVDLTGDDPALADALAVAGSLRRSIPEYVSPPPAEFVEHLRAELVTGAEFAAGSELAAEGELLARPAVDSREHRQLGSATFPLRGAQQPGVADSAALASEGESLGAEFPKPESPEAELSKAKSAEAEFPEAELPNTQLPNTELPNTELSDAQRSAAPLSGPLLSGAELSEAEFWAQLSDPELSVAPVSGGLASGDPDSRNPASAGSRAAGAGAAKGGTGVGGWLARRPWVATGVATAGIVVVLAVQAFGGQGASPGCDGRPCPVSTTSGAAAGAGSSIGTPLTTVRESTTTSSTVGSDAGVVPPTVPRTSAVTAPPTTRPATTAPPTTAAPRPTTTTVPSTTAPPSTAPPTTTTAAPVPPT